MTGRMIVCKNRRFTEPERESKSIPSLTESLQLSDNELQLPDHFGRISGNIFFILLPSLSHVSTHSRLNPNERHFQAICLLGIRIILEYWVFFHQALFSLTIERSLYLERLRLKIEGCSCLIFSDGLLKNFRDQRLIVVKCMRCDGDVNSVIFLLHVEIALLQPFHPFIQRIQAYLDSHK